MGRLPAQWAGKTITARWPYAISGELTLTSGQAAVQFPEATFQNGVDKPFEIHRMIPRVYAQTNGVLIPTQPDQETLLGLVRARFTDLGREQLMTKNATLLGLLCKGSSERSWEFAEPMYLIRSEQIQVIVEALTIPTFAPDTANQLKVAIDFQGFLCVVAPPTGDR